MFRADSLLLLALCPLSMGQDAWSQISAGAKHTCARVKANHCHGASGVCSTKGSIECFGDDFFGQSSPPPGAYAKVASGRDTTCSIRADSSILCWGNPESGIVTGASHAFGFEKISVGGDHACALRQGKIVCWGSNDYGQATLPDTDMAFTDVACGTHHTCGVQKNGYVECWGHDGEKESSGYPSTERFSQVTAGNGHSCGLTIQHRVVCWGRNIEGQSTKPPGDTGNMFFSSVSAGHRHTCAVRDASRSDDAVVCWGSNYAGESRARFRGLFVAVSSGAQHSCGLTSDGDMRCWGSDQHGQSVGHTKKGLRGSRGSRFG